MSNEIITLSNEIVDTKGNLNSEKVTDIINKSNELYLSVLGYLGLPTDNVLSEIEERKSVIRNIPSVINKVDDKLLNDSYYLSKFFIAISDGLFDAALNYLWDETIKQLRIRIINDDVQYFYSVVILDDERRKKFNDPEDIVKIDDFDLIKGASDIDLISPIGYKHLDFIRYMRNWVSAAHPNQSELTGLNLISWLEICIKEVIATPPSNIRIKTSQLLSNIKKEIIDEKQAETISTFFTELGQGKADVLARGFFGIYIDENSSQQTIANINNLLPNLWEIISDEVKYDFGIRYASFEANGENRKKELAKGFLETVNGLAYLPDSFKTPRIKLALKNLMTVHRKFDNFYSEPIFANEILHIIGTHGSVPKEISDYYVRTIVYVFLTNGSGECWDADVIYKKLIKLFDYKQSFIALTSFVNDDIRNKLSMKRCKDKYSELIECIKPNITSDGVLSLMEEVEENIDNLYYIKNEDRLIKKVNYYEKNI